MKHSFGTMISHTINAFNHRSNESVNWNKIAIHTVIKINILSVQNNTKSLRYVFLAHLRKKIMVLNNSRIKLFISFVQIRSVFCCIESSICRKCKHLLQLMWMCGCAFCSVSMWNWDNIAVNCAFFFVSLSTKIVIVQLFIESKMNYSIFAALSFWYCHFLFTFNIF